MLLHVTCCIHQTLLRGFVQMQFGWIGTVCHEISAWGIYCRLKVIQALSPYFNYFGGPRNQSFGNNFSTPQPIWTKLGTKKFTTEFLSWAIIMSIFLLGAHKMVELFQPIWCLYFMCFTWFLIAVWEGFHDKCCAVGRCHQQSSKHYCVVTHQLLMLVSLEFLMLMAGKYLELTSHWNMAPLPQLLNWNSLSQVTCNLFVKFTVSSSLWWLPFGFYSCCLCRRYFVVVCVGD